MSKRPANRGLVLSVVLALALIAAACKPVVAPPPPPPPPWCQSTATTTGSAQKVAAVDKPDGTQDVVTFQASNQSQTNHEVAKLERNGDVVVAVSDQHNFQSVSVQPGDDSLYAQQWGFQAAESDLPGAWTAGLDGSGIRVAVIDTGVQGDHPDLNGKVIAGYDFILPDPSKSNYGQIDGDGHGTHVAGTIAAVDNNFGVIGGAPGATIVPVRVLDCQGSGFTASVAQGINWAVDSANVQVISLSLGGPSDGVLKAAIDHALANKVVVVAAAGNGGPGAQPVYPAAYPGVIAVGAIAQPSVAVRLSGGSDAADTPRATANDITSQDFDFVARVQADDWTPSAAQVIASKLDATGLTGYEPLRLNTDGTLTFTAGAPATDAATSSNSGTPITADGNTEWLRVLRQGTALSFWKAPDSSAVPSTWTSLGGQSVITPTFLSNTDAFVIGSSPALTSPFDGFVRFAELRTSPATTKTAVMVFDASQPPVGVTSWTSAQTGETWTLHGNAAVANGAASYSNTNSYVAVAAPGSNVISTYSANASAACSNAPAGYCYLSGTSMATPHVSAIVTLLEQACAASGGTTPAKVRARLIAKAGPVFGFLSGVGLAKAGAAVNGFVC